MSGKPAKAASRRGAPDDSAGRAQFVKTLVRVLGVQVITLVLLWLLQKTFSY